MPHGQIECAWLKADRVDRHAQVSFKLGKRRVRLGICRASRQVANAGGGLIRTCDAPPTLHNDIGFIDLLQHWLDLFPMARCVLGRL